MEIKTQNIMVRNLFFAIYTIGLFAMIGNVANAQSLLDAVRIADQNEQNLKVHELDNYNSILNSRDSIKYNKFISDYPSSPRTQEIANRVHEIRNWKQAEKTNTIVAYQKYLNETQYHWYDTDANNAIVLIKKQNEKIQWERVRRIGTIDAYRNYLSENPASGYKEDAENAINRLDGAAEWNKIRYTNDQWSLQNFITMYPHADALPDAKLKLHELKGKELFDKNDLNAAYNEFVYIPNDNRIAEENRYAYNRSFEYHFFKLLDSNATETDLNNYVLKYPNSMYNAEVYNRIAIVKAQSLKEYATEQDYALARKYANNEETRRKVESYIDANKENQRQRRKAERTRRRNANGGLWNFGFEFLDFGWNCQDYENEDNEATCKDVYYYNMGISLRLGNYANRFQLALGVKPGYVIYKTPNISYDYYYRTSQNYYSYSDYDINYSFHLPIYAQLKLNICNLKESSGKFFLSGMYQYNTIRDEYVEPEGNWGAGFGFAWKHFDWLLYYKEDTDYTPHRTSYKQGYIATSMIYYWTK
jgi:hypothetical protein